MPPRTSGFPKSAMLSIKQSKKAFAKPGRIRGSDTVLKVCHGGAFAGLEKLIRDRSEKGGIGFGAEVHSVESSKSVGEILMDVEPSDLIGYGLIPEFIGRLPVVSAPIFIMINCNRQFIMINNRNLVKVRYDIFDSCT